MAVKRAAPKPHVAGAMSQIPTPFCISCSDCHHILQRTNCTLKSTPYETRRSRKAKRHSSDNICLLLSSLGIDRAVLPMRRLRQTRKLRSASRIWSGTLISIPGDPYRKRDHQSAAPMTAIHHHSTMRILRSLSPRVETKTAFDFNQYSLKIKPSMDGGHACRRANHQNLALRPAFEYQRAR